MKIAYVTTYDTLDIRQWSGLGYAILNCLKNQGFEVDCIGNLHSKNTFPIKFKKKFYKNFSAMRYLPDRDPILVKSYSRQVESDLSKVNPYVIFSPGTIPIAYLKTDKPIIFYTDATFAGMVNFYASFTNICAESIKHGNKLDQTALTRCALAIYASDWAAKTAIENYDVDPFKVKVLPFGANLTSGMDSEEIQRLIHNKAFDPLKLLFVGVDWKRKGGEKALRVTKLLIDKGLRTELHIVGCDPKIQLPEYAITHGFISKQTDEGKAHLRKLFLDSHFFIMPSEAECFGIVFAEASSFGVPSLGTNVGGIPSAVRDGINGKIFPLNAGAEDYCDFIMSLISSKEKYENLALSSFREYKERLNWETSGKILANLIHEVFGYST